MLLCWSSINRPYTWQTFWKQRTRHGKGPARPGPSYEGTAAFPGSPLIKARVWSGPKAAITSRDRFCFMCLLPLRPQIPRPSDFNWSLKHQKKKCGFFESYIWKSPGRKHQNANRLTNCSPRKLPLLRDYFNGSSPLRLKEAWLVVVDVVLSTNLLHQAPGFACGPKPRSGLANHAKNIGFIIYPKKTSGRGTEVMSRKSWKKVMFYLELKANVNPV